MQIRYHTHLNSNNAAANIHKHFGEFLIKLRGGGVLVEYLKKIMTDKPCLLG